MSAARRFHLPGGWIAELDATADPVVAEEPPRLFASEAAAFRGRLFGPPGGGAEGAKPDEQPATLDDLPLAAFHTLRVLLRCTGAVTEPEIAVVCRNCGDRAMVRPCSFVELGPFRDGELDDAELDAPFDFSSEHPIPEIDRVGTARRDSAPASVLRLEPVSYGQAAALHRALAKPGSLRFTSSVVRAMGVVALGDERDARRIARMLAGASDEAFDAVASWFENAHHPPRLAARHACTACAAVEWLAVPAEREFSVASEDGEPVRRGPARTFPDVDAFTKLVAEHAERIWAETRVGGIDLRVEEGPADCDAGGVPLLGGYLPGDPDALPPASPEITLYYRSFRAEHEEDETFDYEAEIEETLRHEIEHHLHHLAGHDPMDDEERDDVADEAVRRVGRSEARRRAARATRGDVADFFRRTWLVWLLAALATLFAIHAQR